MKEIKDEFKRVGYALNSENVITKTDGKVTTVMVTLHKGRLRFLSASTGTFICSYPVAVDSVRKFLNYYWCAGV